MSSAYHQQQAFCAQGFGFRPIFQNGPPSDPFATMQATAQHPVEQSEAAPQYIRQPLQFGEWVSSSWNPIHDPGSETPLSDPGIKTVRYSVPHGVPLSDELIAALYKAAQSSITGANNRGVPLLNFDVRPGKAPMPNFAKVTRNDSSYVDLSFPTYLQAATFVHHVKTLEFSGGLTLMLHSHGAIHEPKKLGITIVPHLLEGQDVMSVPLTAFAQAIASLKALMEANRFGVLAFVAKGCVHVKGGGILLGAWQDAIGTDLQRKASCAFDTSRALDLATLPGFISSQPTEFTAGEWDPYDASQPPHIFELQYRSRPEHCTKCLGRAHSPEPCRYLFCKSCKAFGHTADDGANGCSQDDKASPS